MSARRFSTLAKISKSPIHLIMTGVKAVPPKRIEAWADALELQGKERDLFLEEAWLTNSPRFIVERYRVMKKRL